VRIGGGSRISTANLKAFRELPMTPEDMEPIFNAILDIMETPGVLGGYYTERHIKNAWNLIIIDSKKILTRDAYDIAVENVIREMRSKQEEYPQWLPSDTVGEVEGKQR